MTRYADDGCRIADQRDTIPDFRVQLYRDMRWKQLEQLYRNMRWKQLEKLQEWRGISRSMLFLGYTFGSWPVLAGDKYIQIGQELKRI